MAFVYLVEAGPVSEYAIHSVHATWLGAWKALRPLRLAYENPCALERTVCGCGVRRLSLRAAGYWSDDYYYFRIGKMPVRD